MIEKYLRTQVAIILPDLQGKIFPTEAPQKTLHPYAVYNCTGATQESTLTGDGTLHTETIQLDIYGDTYGQVKGYFDTLRAALLNYRGSLGGYQVQWIKESSALDGFEPEVLEQKVTLEFEIYY